LIEDQPEETGVDGELRLVLCKVPGKIPF